MNNHRPLTRLVQNEKYGTRDKRFILKIRGIID